MTTFEYRKFFRADIVVRVRYKTTKGPRLSGVAFSKNLSQTGLCIVTADKLFRNTELELKIYVDDRGKPLTASGLVIWQSECSFVPESKRKYYVTGVQIRDMSPDDAIKGSDFVRDFLIRKSEEENKTIIEKLESLK